jgi:hypothetical protein
VLLSQRKRGEYTSQSYKVTKSKTLTTPHAPCTPNCMQNAPAANAAKPLGKIHSGMNAPVRISQSLQRKRCQHKTCILKRPRKVGDNTADGRAQRSGHEPDRKNGNKKFTEHRFCRRNLYQGDITRDGESKVRIENISHDSYPPSQKLRGPPGDGATCNGTL